MRSRFLATVVALAALPACGMIAGVRDLQLVGGDASALSSDGPGPTDDASQNDQTVGDARGGEDTFGVDGGMATDGGADAPDGRSARDAATVDDGGEMESSASSADAGDAQGATDATDAAPAPSCDAGLLSCNGVCVDPAHDPNNCNGCGNTCGGGSCGTVLSPDMTAKPARWNFNGAAAYDPVTKSAVLTPAMPYSAGTFIFAQPIVLDAFTAKFDFRMGLGGGTRSDGMGFMFQRTGPNAVGTGGGGLGMLDLAGFGVELDIYNNGLCGDTSGDHVAIDSLAFCAADPSNPLPTSLAVSPDLTKTVDLADAQWHVAVASLQSGQMSVAVDGVPILSDVVVPGLDEGALHYFGFGAGTGGLVLPNGSGGYRMEVQNVTVTFPTPRCL